MQLDIYPEAVKFISTLDAKRFKQVLSKILALLADPEPQDCAKLKGYPFLRVDIGAYRVVYTHDGEVVTVILGGKRNDDEVYKDLSRKNFKPG